MEGYPLKVGCGQKWGLGGHEMEVFGGDRHWIHSILSEDHYSVFLDN